MTSLAATSPPVRKPRLGPMLGRAAVGVGILSTFGQAAVLGVCAAVARGAGTATVLHRAGPGYDVAAWRYPLRGAWGMTITIGEAVVLLSTMVMAVSAVSARRRVGLLLMAGWGAYWAWRIGTVAYVTHDALDFGLAAAALVAMASQVVLCVRWWNQGPRTAVGAVIGPSI